MAETTCLLNMRTWKQVPGVRIPLSPPDYAKASSGEASVFFWGVAPAFATLRMGKQSGLPDEAEIRRANGLFVNY